MILKIAASLLLPIALNAATLRSLNTESAPFSLPKLPYAMEALAPIISKETMELHHGKHHKAYVDNINSAIGKKRTTLLDLLKSTKDHPPVVRNNAGGHWNHAFFWTVLVPEKEATAMSKPLEEAIKKSFGSVDAFKQEFEKQAAGLFGSGWVWLIRTSGGLKIVTTTNQDNPLMDIAADPGHPILALDVWEHAYYLTYQNRRAEYVKNFWKIVNWEQVSQYFAEK